MSKKIIGRLNFRVISLLNLNIAEDDIFLNSKRKQHMKKHINEFSNFEDTYNKINLIISKPDYVGLHPNGKSIEYIKNIDGNVLVAVRIGDKLTVRTMYVITQNKLNNYINAGRTFKY